MKYLIAVLMFFVIIFGVYADNSTYEFTSQDNDNLEWVGSWPFGRSQACATDTVRDLCFLQSGGGVYIFDISDPVNPVKLSENIRTEGIINHLSYDYIHKFLFVSRCIRPDNDPLPHTEYPSTEIWDISDCQNPQFISEFNLGSYKQYDLKDTLIYIIDNIDEYNEYTVLNFSDPYNVRKIYSSDMCINDLCLKDSLLFIASDSILIFNNSDLLNPSIISTIPYSNIFFIETKDNYLFAARINNKSIFVFDISDPQNPIIIDSCSISIPTHIGLESIILHRDFIYLSEVGDLEIIDISDPTNCFSHGCFTVFNCWADRKQFSACAEYVFLPFSGYGLITVDVSDSSNPQIVNQIELNYSNPDFSIKNNYLYLIDCKSEWMAEHKLRVIDISDLTNPHQVVECVLTGSPISIEINNNYAYISEVLDTFSYLLEIVDITDPLEPVVVKKYSLIDSFFPHMISINDNLMHISYGYLYDISNPIEPVYITQLNKPGYQMIIENNLGYTAGYNFIYIFDLQDPYNPILISSVPYHWGGEIFDIQGDHLYLVSYHSGKLHIFNISDPYNPWNITDFKFTSPNFFSYSWSIDAEDNYAVISATGPSPYTANGKVFIVDVSDLNNINIESSKTLYGEGPHLEILGQNILVSTLLTGLQIYQYPPLMSISESPPTTPLTSITLNTTIFPLSNHSILSLSGLPSKGSVSIYSVDGRKIIEEEFSQSDFSLNLNNLNISSGVYFIKISDQHRNDLTINKFEVLR